MHRIDFSRWGLLLSLIALLSILLLFSNHFFDHIDPLLDFLSYWSAGVLYWSGANPYSAEEILYVQRLNGYTGSVPFMFLSPPWLLLPLYPLSLLSPIEGYSAWVLFSLCTAVWGSLIAQRSLHISREYTLPLFVLFIAFPPLWETLRLGQLSLFLFLGVALANFTIASGNVFAAFLSGVLLSLKPNLTFLFPLLFFVRWLREPQLTPCIVFLIGYVLSPLLVLLFQESLLLDWLKVISEQSSQAGFHPPLFCKTTSLASIIRFSVLEENFVSNHYFFAFTFAVGATFLFCLFLMTRTAISNPLFLAQVAVTASYCATPYAWSYDMIVLFIPFLYGVNVAIREGRVVFSVGYFSLLVALVIHWISFAQFHHEFFWFPPLLLFMLVFQRIASKEIN